MNNFLKEFWPCWDKKTRQQYFAFGSWWKVKDLVGLVKTMKHKVNNCRCGDSEAVHGEVAHWQPGYGTVIGQIVCPGDFIVKLDLNTYWVMSRAEFEEKYSREEPGPAMTSGEKMVWASAYAQEFETQQRWDLPSRGSIAAAYATEAVLGMRAAVDHRSEKGEDKVRDMLCQMLEVL